MNQKFRFYLSAAIIMLFSGSAAAQHLYIPGNNHSSATNNRGIGIGIDDPDAKLHLRDRFDNGTALLIDIGIEQYAILGGGTGY